MSVPDRVAMAIALVAWGAILGALAATWLIS